MRKGSWIATGIAGLALAASALAHFTYGLDENEVAIIKSSHWEKAVKEPGYHFRPPFTKVRTVEHKGVVRIDRHIPGYDLAVSALVPYRILPESEDWQYCVLRTFGKPFDTRYENEAESNVMYGLARWIDNDGNPLSLSEARAGVNWNRTKEEILGTLHIDGCGGIVEFTDIYVHITPRT